MEIIQSSETINYICFQQEVIHEVTLLCLCEMSLQTEIEKEKLFLICKQVA